MLRLLLGLVTLTVLLGAGCTYRVSAPAPLGEALAVSVAGSRTRLVRAQGYVQREVARAVRERMGWQISPMGSARLELVLLEEEITESATSVEDIPFQWSMTIRARALLITSEHGVFTTDNPLAGVGYAGSRLDEPQALQAAGEDLAASAADWVEHLAATWQAAEAAAEAEEEDEGAESDPVGSFADEAAIND